MQIDMDVSDRLKELMDERGMTMYALGKKSGVPWNTIKNYYARKTKPNIQTIAQLCDGLGITLAQFFDDSGETVYLTEEEEYLLQRWRVITERQKKVVGDMLDIMTGKE